MLVPVLLLLLLALVACGSKINEANFDKIKKDMTQEEVYALLGQPTESSSLRIGGLSGSSSTWTSEEATISIQFLNEKVKAKEFSKPGK
jgi:hypothetical protein